MQNNAQDSASRAWTRIPVLETAVVYLPNGRPTVGLLVDESFGGVRLMFRDAAAIRAGSLVVGDIVTVVYHRVPMQAVVRNRSMDEAEQLFVGLEWRE